jgi:hypothetical protein
LSAQSIEARIAHLEGTFDQVSERLNSIDRRLDGMDRRLFGEVSGLRRDMNQRFNWLLGIVMTSWITTILAMTLHH